MFIEIDCNIINTDQISWIYQVYDGWFLHMSDATSIHISESDQEVLESILSPGKIKDGQFMPYAVEIFFNDEIEASEGFAEMGIGYKSNPSLDNGEDWWKEK